MQFSIKEEAMISVAEFQPLWRNERGAGGQGEFVGGQARTGQLGRLSAFPTWQLFWKEAAKAKQSKKVQQQRNPAVKA
jgi:hypothetical protein